MRSSDAPLSRATDGWPARGTLLAHYFNDDAFLPLTVEFRIINLLPWSEIQFPERDRENDFVVDDQAFQVRIAVRLARAMVPVILPKRSEFLQPLVDVANQTVFGVVDIHASRNVHRRNENHAFRDSALRQRRLDLRGDVNILPVIFVRNVKYSVWNCMTAMINSIGLA
jgi:hypothetical protein